MQNERHGRGELQHHENPTALEALEGQSKSGERRTYAGAEQEAWLEAQADALLRSLPLDMACPTYTEAGLARRGQRHCVLSVDILAEWVAAGPSLEQILEELNFVARLTPLSPQERACLRGWLLGWTQQEVGATFADVLDANSQKQISRALRSALRKCYDSAWLSFSECSRHTIYRRPARRRDALRLLACARCGEAYAFGCGAGRYCSPGCRDAATRRE